ncbi:hypothetical protein PTSG_10608 [Salpingoeca rosetta]|uniref:Cytochrome b561 bacterial/Ni-hydrogenase domain-containing protein n=1 Tax=Salpingoeca rosetta (strain ATCC 50818 / BSB-021) TaxID=946362 RepID=F2URU9_SALR5|nr:uncharacterized protein PTSG_10608 [Salpingoeca rosetta]EGD80354.1 hypothetical protein PTSG_10608 [Salpingoeca rosetta]|eukprot:XP_004988144.1 hypothetical protein PTSG_10608 [Salpingoeca rosetta]
MMMMLRSIGAMLTRRAVVPVAMRGAAAPRRFLSLSGRRMANGAGEATTAGQAASTAGTATGAATATQAVEVYSRRMQALHWLVGAGMLTCVATVKMAQWTEDKKKKGQYMMIHKSTALLVAALVVPRVAIRLASKMPKALPGTSKFEQLAGSFSHFLMYVAMIGMPVTGITMGYFGGKGLPFYGAHIPGTDTPNKKVAGTAFKVHKKMGQVLEYVLALHIGATIFHMFQGIPMLTRMGFALSPTSTTSAALLLAAFTGDDAASLDDDDIAAAFFLHDNTDDGDDDGEEEEEEEE